SFAAEYIGVHSGSLSYQPSRADILAEKNIKTVTIFEKTQMADSVDGQISNLWMAYFDTSTQSGSHSTAYKNGENDARRAYTLASTPRNVMIDPAVTGNSDPSSNHPATFGLDQPFGSTIYFAMDLNQSSALDGIQQYFEGIRDYFATLPSDKQYLIGVYGSADTLARLARPKSLSPEMPLAQSFWLSTSWPGSSLSLNGGIPAVTNVSLDLWQPDV